MPNEDVERSIPDLCALQVAFTRANPSGAWPRARATEAAEMLARAEIDLLLVHHAEIARVLTRAVRWLERRERGPRLSAFQKRAAGALAAARASGAFVPSAAERVAHKRPIEWPSAFLLARTAFELDPTTAHEQLMERLQAVGNERDEA